MIWLAERMAAMDVQSLGLEPEQVRVEARCSPSWLIATDA